MLHKSKRTAFKAVFALCITQQFVPVSAILTAVRVINYFNCMKALHGVAFILLVIGGLNWLLVGLFNWGIGDVIGMSLAKLVYILVGLSAIYLVSTHKKDCRQCSAGGAM